MHDYRTTAAALSLGALALVGCVGPDPRGRDGARQSSSRFQRVSDPGIMAAEIEPVFSYRGAGRLRALMGEGQAPTYCAYQVERKGNGTAAVTITKPDGTSLVVRFTTGTATSVEIGESSVSFTGSKEGGMHIIKVGQERYGILNSVIHG